MTGALAGWGEFSLALAAFFASHIVPARPAVQRFLRARLGRTAYIALYSSVSLGILAWLVIAAGRAPYLSLWGFETWQLWAPNIAMPLACLLIAFGLAAPNPFSVAGRPAPSFDPQRPGIAGITRHPFLWAITLWAISHTIPNGDLAHVILFGLFALFGIAGMMALDRRKQRQMGAELWKSWAARTSFVPLAAVLTGRFQLSTLRPDPVRAIAALALYLTLIFSHQAVIGVSPLP